ncbi:MAG: GDSL-type esterase/lipase family protein [Elusimicrobiota bacterium]
MKRKVLWLGAGILTTLVLFEAGFRVLGLFLGPAQGVAGARRTILCEGDSFTYGIGGESFPQQLEKILNDRAGGRIYHAVNKGIPGLNTALLADRLEGHLRRYRPAVVIVLAGENNSWNSIRLSAPAETAGGKLALDRLLLRSRVYKFIKVMAIGWSHRTFHNAAPDPNDVEKIALYAIENEEAIGLPHPDDDDDREDGDYAKLPPVNRVLFTQAKALEQAGKYDEAAVLYQKLIDRHPDIVLGYTGLGACHLRHNRYREAIAVLEKGIGTNPSPEKENAYFELGWAYVRSGSAENAVRTWRRGLTEFPLSKRIYQAMARTYHERNDVWKALAVEREAPEVAHNPLHRYLKRLHETRGETGVARLISDSFRADIRRIISLAREYDAEVIFASYPDNAHDEVSETARAQGARYIDFRPVFKREYKSRGEYISDDDCHCNTAGYRTMAATFADEVEALLK